MTNEELIKLIRSSPWSDGFPYLSQAADRIETLMKERDEALEAKLDAIDTLNAWFDRRELGHKAVDQAVVDAASGYLRTSRVGGMPKEESDLIIGVIADMARLGLFADLFARSNVSTEAKVAKLVEALQEIATDEHPLGWIAISALAEIEGDQK